MPPIDARSCKSSSLFACDSTLGGGMRLGELVRSTRGAIERCTPLARSCLGASDGWTPLGRSFLGASEGWTPLRRSLGGGREGLGANAVLREFMCDLTCCTHSIGCSIARCANAAPLHLEPLMRAPFPLNSGIFNRSRATRELLHCRCYCNTRGGTDRAPVSATAPAIGKRPVQRCVHSPDMRIPICSAFHVTSRQFVAH